MKYVDACCYTLGAFAWPWTAGLMAGLGSENWFTVIVLLIWSFIAWWKIIGWVRTKRGMLGKTAH